MTRSTLAFTGIVLFFSALGLYFLNRQPPPTTEVATDVIAEVDAVPDIEFVENPTELPPTPVPTDEPTDEPTATTIPTNTPRPTVAPTAVSEATPTVAPPTETPSEESVNEESASETTDEGVSEEVAEVVEATPTPNGLYLIAVKDAALFTQPIDVDHTGYYVPTGTTAWAVGRSYDDRWIHVKHPLGGEGWAVKSYFTTFSGDLSVFDYLPYSEFTGAPGNVTPTPFEVAETAGNAGRNTVSSAPAQSNNTAQTTTSPSAPPLPTPGPATFYSGQETSAIAYWLVDYASQIIVGGGKYQAGITVRVPTGSRYGFDISNISRTETRYRNQDGDDMYVVYVSGLTCGEDYFLNLRVSQDGAVMQTRNDNTYTDGAIYLNWDCR